MATDAPIAAALCIVTQVETVDVLDADTADFEQLTDDELTALALAADPEMVIDDDAEPFSAMGAGQPDGLLPEWYMPTSVGASRLPRGWRRRVVLLIIVAFLAIAASGLCSTYGQIVVA